MRRDRIFFVAVDRRLNNEDLAALDQEGVVVRGGIATPVGPWQGTFEDVTSSTSVLRVEAEDRDAAAALVRTVLGTDLKLEVRPISSQRICGATVASVEALAAQLGRGHALTVPLCRTLEREPRGRSSLNFPALSIATISLIRPERVGRRGAGTAPLG